MAGVGATIGIIISSVIDPVDRNALPALQYFHRDISGNNNGDTVSPGQTQSEVLGNSTLDIKNFVRLQFVAPAGAAGTPSNA